MSGRSLGERAFIGLQYLLPQHLLSRLVGWIAGSRIGFVRAALIRMFLGALPRRPRGSRAARSGRYSSFNDFFTRRLRPARGRSTQTRARPSAPPTAL